MSIKWKITLSLIIVSLCLVSIYIFTATKIFESDKISYIFEEQQNKNQLQVQKFNQAIDSSIWFARLLFKDQNISEKKPEQEALLKNQSFIEAIFIFDYTSKDINPFFLKNAKTTLDFALFYDKLNYKKLSVIHYAADNFIASVPLHHTENKVILLLIDWSVGAEESSNVQRLFFEKNKIIKSTGTNYINETEAGNLVNSFISSSGDVQSSTTKVNIGEATFLTSYAKTNYEGLSFVSLTNEKDALMALNELYNKSIIFLIISALFTFIISLLLSNSITYRINQLIDVAAEIGKGNFDISFNDKSTDEVGILSQAFGKMGTEIKKLFADKLEKDRMERELKNAGIIQDKLFPGEKNMHYDNYCVNGHYQTSTECGGDWWHYYKVGDYLYAVIADATGHGTPAALVTSASNAIFAHLRSREATLDELVDIWDHVVYETSKGEVLMTAQITRLHIPSGKCEIVNLGHEPPVLFNREKNSASYVNLSPNYSLGEKKNSSKKIQEVQLNKGDHLILYTDGVPASLFKEKQEMSEKQILRLYNTFLQGQPGSDNMSANVYKFLREKTDVITQLEDDITLVSISRL